MLFVYITGVQLSTLNVFHVRNMSETLLFVRKFLSKNAKSKAK